MKSQRPRFDILGLGAVAVDDLILVESYPAADSKTRVLRTDRQCGGRAAIALIAATRLGSKCAYAGVLGRDEFSKFVIGQMRKEGVSHQYLTSRKEARPFHSFIVIDAERHTRAIFSDPSGVSSVGAGWPTENAIRSARVLFVDHSDSKASLRAAQIARKAGIPVVADFERISGPQFPKLLQLADHLIISQSFARKLSGERNPAQAIKVLWTSGRKLVAVTCGAKGCWYRISDEAKVKHQVAFTVKVVDTTGCGDVFHGAYASALARGLAAEDCIRFASAAAALKSTQLGAQAGIPTRAAVEKFLKSHS